MKLEMSLSCPLMSLEICVFGDSRSSFRLSESKVMELQIVAGLQMAVFGGAPIGFSLCWASNCRGVSFRFGK